MPIHNKAEKALIGPTRIFGLTVLVLICLWNEINGQAVNRMIPDTLCPQNWQRDGEPEYAFGKDLYLLINGGAEVCLEYGFKEALFQSWMSDDHQMVHTEIYGFQDSEGAYGWYTFKSGQSGKAVDVGCAAWLSGYYLTIWMNDRVISVISAIPAGLDADLLTDLGSRLCGQDTCRSAVPRLCADIRRKNPDAEKITLLKGMLALFNQYPNAPSALNGFISGAAAQNKETKVITLVYTDSIMSRRIYKLTVGQIRGNPEIKEVSHNRDLFYWTEKNEHRCIFFNGDNLFIIRSEKKIKSDSIRNHYLSPPNTH